MTILDMLKQYVFSFYEVVIRLEKLRNSAALHASIGPSYSASHLPKWAREELAKSLGDMRKECEIIMLSDTADLISFMESEVLRKDDEYSYADMLKDLDTLNFSFSTGLRKRSFFGMEDEKKKFFQKDDLFGSKVNIAFPSCVPEIQNAGNCYALEQYEASAFHSMKVLERGLGTLAKRFGVDFSHTNWPGAPSFAQRVGLLTLSS